MWITASFFYCFHRGIGQWLQATVARRDCRVAVGDTDHGVVEVFVFVTHGEVHRAVGRTGHALGDVLGTSIDAHCKSSQVELDSKREFTIL